MAAEPALQSGLQVVIQDDDDAARVDPETGTIEVPDADGGVVVHLDAKRPAEEDDEDPFFANLAEKLDPTKLGVIAEDLHQAISTDDQSRQGNLANYEKAISLLGLKLEDPKPSVGDSSAAADGLSVVTNPLMLEAVLKGWANAEAELLPAAGPVKVKDDGEADAARDDLAEALERDMNHYFTVGAPEYYPDTSHMLLWGTHLRGSGFKKVYRCPLRRRPVSESVDAKDLIVSDTMKDLRSCSRVTHQSTLTPSRMKRMIFAGAYREVALGQPSGQASGVDEKIAGVQGTTARPSRPEDQPYTVWECQCELDLDEFAPRKFKGEGIPLPYIVTLDKDDHTVYAIRRDWEEDDPECQRKRMYVRYPYIPGPGFYGTGLLNVLGNASAAMTAAWRITLDCGMLGNFPGGVITKDAARQNTNIIKPGPTEFAPVETGGKDIRQVVMGLPYKDVTPGMLALMDKIVAQAKDVGSAAAIPVGEGLANIPVGTMLAAVEQATKVMAAAFKGMHAAQSEEIEMICDLFRLHPEDFWRNKRDAQKFWDEQKFIAALNDYRLVPVSDPNVPSHIHRLAVAMGLVQLTTNPVLGPRLSADEVLKRALNALRVDPRGLIAPAPVPGAAPPDPLVIAKLQEAQAKTTTAQAKAQESQAKVAQLPQEQALEQQKLQTERDIAAKDIVKEQLIHGADMAKVAQAAAVDHHEQAREDIKTAHDIAQDHHDRRMDVASHALDVAGHHLDVHQALNPPQPAKPTKGS